MVEKGTMSDVQHLLRSQLDQDNLRRIRINLMQLHERLGDFPISDEEVDGSTKALREQTLSLLTALRRL